MGSQMNMNVNNSGQQSINIDSSSTSTTLKPTISAPSSAGMGMLANEYNSKASTTTFWRKYNKCNANKFRATGHEHEHGLHEQKY